MDATRPPIQPLRSNRLARGYARGAALVALAGLLASVAPTFAATRLAPRGTRAQDGAASRIPTFSTAAGRDRAAAGRAAQAVRPAGAEAVEYSVADSGSAAGPVFEYTTLTGASARTVVSGASRLATVELGGPGFPVGDSVVRSLHVSTDGFLSTAADEAGYDRSAGWSPSSGIRIVALGAAMRGSVSHAYDAAQGANVFQWRVKSTETGAPARFQAKLFDDGTIVVLFDEIGANDAAFTGIVSADPAVVSRSYSRRTGTDRLAVSFANKGERAGGPRGGGCPTTLTHSSSTAITPLNSVSCNDGVGHTDNSYWRAFNLTAFGASGTYNVTSVDIGIEEASSGSAGRGGGQPVTVNIYENSTGTAFPTGFPGSLTLVGTTSTTIADQSGTVVNIPVTADVDADAELVLELFTPSGETAGNLFFIGSNGAPETGPSYLTAAQCGVTAPTATAALGFPDMHMVMSVNGSCTPDCLVTCPANVTQSNDPSQCGAVVNFPAPTTTGNCGTVSCSPPSGSFFPVGSTTVTCTSSVGPSCSFTVTINDTQNPTITCPANVTVGNDPNQCGAVVSFAAPVVSDNCPGSSVSCSPPSGSFFPQGTTSVTCTATDASGNTGSCSFTVTVNDTQNPTITCPANVTVGNAANQCGAAVTFAAPVVSDNCPGATVACVPASGSFFAKGTTTVTCTATDAVGNTGSCSFTVTVNDTQAPTVVCPANITAPASSTQGTTLGAVVTYTAPAASDNCPGATVVCLPASGSFFPKGTTTVTCTATDAVGNTGSCSFTVTVASAFTDCYYDDATGNVLSIVTDPASPLYRLWQLRIVSTGQIIQGNAEYLSYIAGRSCVAYDHDSTTARMDLNANYNSRTAAATVTQLPGNRQFTVRDRNLANNPPCQ